MNEKETGCLHIPRARARVRARARARNDVSDLIQ